MPSIAEFTLPVGGFPLGRIFETRPAVTLELDRVVPSGDTVMPYFWVTDREREFAAVETFFAQLPELRSAELLVEMGDRGLYRAEWEPAYMGIMEAIASTGVTVVAASGSSDGWSFEIRAMENGQLSAFQRRCRELGVDLSLTRLSQLTAVDADADPGLTAQQREALVLAYEQGYYDTNRSVDQAALAAQIGISRQALAARLRRGYRQLIEAALIPNHRR